MSDLSNTSISDRPADDEEKQPVSAGVADLGHHGGKQSWKEIFMLSFSSLGAIYGDLGTSPLYVINSIDYRTDTPTEDDILGGISAIFWVFTIIVIFKYVLIVLFIGPNNGEGGQVAIYSKIARYLKIGPKGVRIPGSPAVDDMDLIERVDTTYSLERSKTRASVILGTNGSWKDNKIVLKFVQYIILFCCFLGCALVFSDGLLTPTTSVLSAVGGIQIAQPSFSNKSVLAISEVIMVGLFMLQPFGSHKVSFLFAPILFIWMIGLAICGVYNIAKYDASVFRAISPHYAIKLMKKSGIDVLGGAMLSITGVEAMFADIGHFGRLPIQLTLGCFVYPILVLTYMGQGAYILEHPQAWTNPFFNSLPGGKGSGPYWVMFVLATLSTIIASQALILSVFSIISQLINLDCFPQLKIVHVSKRYAGKVYIPTINWMLMIGVCLTTAGFETSSRVTAAYGLGINLDLFVTSVLIVLCMIYVYKWSVFIPIAYILFFVPLELSILGANIRKIPHGGWFPICVATIIVSFLSLWRWSRSKKVDFEFKSRVRINHLFPALDDTVVELGQKKAVFHTEDVMDVNPEFIGVDKISVHPGVAFLHNETSSVVSINSPNTLPRIYSQVLRSFPSLPTHFIFVSTSVLPLPIIPDEDRIIYASMKIKGHFKCVVRFGFAEDVKITPEIIQEILDIIPGARGLPVTHIHENNTIKSKRAVGNKFFHFFRKLAINWIYAPINSLTHHNLEIVKYESAEEEEKQRLVVGGVVRI